MTSRILRNSLAKIDSLGLTKRGPGLWPAVILDGHITRMGDLFLEYVTTDETKWMGLLNAIYGTGSSQLHDDERQNGAFKMALSKSKITDPQLHWP